MQHSSQTFKDIQVDVDFYDIAEREKLMGFPTANTIEEIVSGPIDIPAAEFLTYYLFHHIKVGKPGYHDYKSVASKIGFWVSAIGECFDFQNGSIRNPEGIAQQLNEVTEHIGEAIGLSVANRIHGLTEADWKPIDQQRGQGAKPTFDFQIASDGESFIQLETKGSSVEDNRIVSDSVKAQKRIIEKKKDKLNILVKKGEDPFPAGIRYGAIAVIDSRIDGNVRCFLTDPPPEEIEEDPKRFRLETRMRFLFEWISFIGPRSALATALATRIGDLEALGNPFELDGIPLMRAYDKPFDYYSFMTSKSRVADGPAGGVVVQISKKALFFLGIREELLAIASYQSFQEIINYKAQVATIRKTIECSFSPTRFSQLQLPPSLKIRARQAGNYYKFKIRGFLHYSPEGLVFGVLPLPEE